MSPTLSQVTAVEDWFRSAFPGYEISSRDLSLRDVVLFRAHDPKPGSPRHELEISYEAFDDNPIDTILADLRSLKAAARLVSRPEERLIYDRFRQLRTAPSASSAYRPDFALYSPEGELEMVGEVKTSSDASPNIAASIRRNLLVHGALPNARFFLIFFPERLFLWKDVGSQVDSLPSRSAPIRDVLRDYLGERADGSVRLAEESLELALSAWFRDLATATREPSDASEADRVVVESGLYAALRRGRIATQSR